MGDIARKRCVSQARHTLRGWFYFGARYYDPSIGRWLTPDPLADDYPSFSPYNYCLNNPVSNVDPDGRWVWGAVIGAVVEAGSQVATDMIVNKSSFMDAVKNIDIADVGIAAGVGLATGGLNSLKTIGTLTKVGVNVAANMGEGYAKSKLGTKTNEYTVGNAVTDGTVGLLSGAGSEIGKGMAQNTKQAAKLNKTARKMQNIANKGRARPAQALRAAKAQKAAASFGGGPAAQSVTKTTSTATSQVVNQSLKEEEERK